jgi:hypothetical protein
MKFFKKKISKETMDKILSGEKKTFCIDGYTYKIHIEKNSRLVRLIPDGNWGIEVSSHSFPVGRLGRQFCKAVKIAKEISDALPRYTDV